MATRRGAQPKVPSPIAGDPGDSALGDQASEAELRRLNATLEQTIAERTREIEQAEGELKLRDAELESSREAQLSSEQKYRAYIDNAPDGICVIDDKGRYPDVNPAACNMTGCTRVDLLGMSVADLSWQPSDRLLAGMATLMDPGRVSAEPVPRHKDGSPIYSTLDGVRLSKDRFIGFCKDNTKRHEAEEERRALLEQVRYKQKLESLGLLAEGIAHDFNNRLVGILGTAELMLEDLPADSPSRAMARRITNVARQIGDLNLQMLVELSRFTNHRPVLLSTGFHDGAARGSTR